MTSADFRSLIKEEKIIGIYVRRHKYTANYTQLSASCALLGHSWKSKIIMLTIISVIVYTSFPRGVQFVHIRCDNCVIM